MYYGVQAILLTLLLLDPPLLICMLQHEVPVRVHALPCATRRDIQSRNDMGIVSAATQSLLDLSKYLMPFAQALKSSWLPATKHFVPVSSSHRAENLRFPSLSYFSPV